MFSASDSEVVMALIRAGVDMNHKNKVSVYLNDWIEVSGQRLSRMRVLPAVFIPVWILN